MPTALDDIDLSGPERVIALLHAGAAACRDAACRRGATELAGAPHPLVATGDLHDGALHMARAAALAGLHALDTAPGAHLTLHELIHPADPPGGLDLSIRALARAAALKSAFPEHVHVLLANHELSQVSGRGIVKDGVNVNELFAEGVEHLYAHEAAGVLEAAGAFIRALPLALRYSPGTGGDVLCAHSLPAPELMDRFDPGVLDRLLTDEDYVPRRGSAHLMVWGRGHTPSQLEELARGWDVALFVLGHEKAPDGALAVPPCAIVLNSDHPRAAALVLDGFRAPLLDEAMALVRPLAAAVA